MKESLASKIRAANSTLVAQATPAAIADFFSPDYVVHLTDGDLAGGHEIVRGFLAQYRRAFPDLQLEVEILVEGKNRIAWQRMLRATHEGAFRGFPATGRTLVWRDVVTSRFRGGRIAEEWLISDLAEQLLLARKTSVSVKPRSSR